MRALYLLLALALVLMGHSFRLLRWEQFIRIYERPMRGRMLRGMAGGYALNFVLPFHLGDVFRAVFTGRRMKSGIGFSLATVIMDRFLDVWFVALGFIGFWAAGFGGEVVHRAARYYLVFSLVLGYNLKVAVGTSTMVMTLVALTGAVSHISMGAQIFPIPMLIVVISCLLGALVSAKFANKCEITRLNKIVGVVLTILGVATILIKVL